MIRKLEVRDVPSCAELIYSAFRNDPLFVVQCKSENEKRAFSTFLCRKSVVLKESGIVFQSDDQIKGMASFEHDTGKLLSAWKGLLSWQFIKEIFKLKRIISSEGFRFMNQYMRFTTSVRPKAPHYYLVFIGVSPKSQGQGVGHQLLNYIHAVVDADSDSVGIGLDTENEANVTYYKRFGYELISQTTINQVTIYAMFRKRTLSS